MAKKKGRNTRHGFRGGIETIHLICLDSDENPQRSRLTFFQRHHYQRLYKVYTSVIFFSTLNYLMAIGCNASTVKVRAPKSSSITPRSL